MWFIPFVIISLIGLAVSMNNEKDKVSKMTEEEEEEQSSKSDRDRDLKNAPQPNDLMPKLMLAH